MSSKVEILNPLEYPGWDELLLTNENYSFFHSSAWARVLHESYNYKPLYFTCINNGRLSALIPVMDIKSLLTGRRGVSLPFTDFCPPIVSDKAQFHEIVDRITEYGKKARWKHIEWRGGESCFLGVEPSLSYYGHTLSLTPDEHEIFAGFRDSTKRNIEKATREGVEVSIQNSSNSIREFYRLNCITRKRHGLPPQPFFFFKKVFEHIISEDLGIVALAFYQAKPIAGAVFLHVGKKAYFKYGASDTAYHHYRPNNLVMWKAIEFYAKNGFSSFDFGRTEPGNMGLLQFKRGWGTREETIKYYKYDLMKNAYLQDNSRVIIFSNVLKKAPIPLLNLVGSLFYRHAG